MVTSLGYGIITFAIVIGVGLLVLDKFATSVAECPTGYKYNYDTTNATAYTDNQCCLDGGSDCSSTGNYTAASEGTQSNVYMMGQVGEDGLAGWTPAIIALVIGMLFLGMFLAKGKRV